MRGMMLALFAAVALACAPQASAQSMEENQAFLRWAQQFHTMVSAVTQPLGAMPQVDPSWDRRQRQQWTREARAWSESYRATLAEVQARANALRTPTFTDAGLQRQLAQQASALPALLTGLVQLLDRYDQAIVAIERNRPQAFLDAAMASLDAQQVILTQFRDTNAMQGALIEDYHPQKHLLSAFTESYVATLVIVDIHRAQLRGDVSDRAGFAARMRTASNAMLAATARGRDATASLIAQVRAMADSPERTRFLAAMDTYYGSFNREDLIAGEFATVATLLESRRSIEDIAAEIDQHAENAGVLDLERAGDIQRRISMLQ